MRVIDVPCKCRVRVDPLSSRVLDRPHWFGFDYCYMHLSLSNIPPFAALSCMTHVLLYTCNFYQSRYKWASGRQILIRHFISVLVRNLLREERKLNNLALTVRAGVDAASVSDEGYLTEEFHPKFTYPVCFFTGSTYEGLLRRQHSLDFRRGRKDLWL
jgi:hypothetical protein